MLERKEEWKKEIVSQGNQEKEIQGVRVWNW